MMDSTLPEESAGTRRERQVRELAARLGVADFVFTCPTLRKGEGSREVSGDGLLLVGSRGAVLQVKSRDPEVRDSDDGLRARSWVAKHAKKARAQGLGTKRELERHRRSGTPVVVTPARAVDLPEASRAKYGRSVDADPSTWPVIVIVDHPLASGIDLGFEENILYITFEDWHELHRRLRSTSGLLDYVERVVTDKVHVALGHERHRYRALQRADQAAVAGVRTGFPTLPDPAEFDEGGADLLHDIIDKIWPDDGLIPWQEPDEYRSIVEFLDRIPPTLQSRAGRWVLGKLTEFARTRLLTSGSMMIGNRDRLIFACDLLSNRASVAEWGAEVSALAAVRHNEALATGAPADSQTLGIGALVRDDPGSTGALYMFALVQGSVAVPSDVQSYIEHRFGVHDHRRRQTMAIKVGRNDPCFCGSGKKHKRCHGA